MNEWIAAAVLGVAVLPETQAAEVPSPQCRVVHGSYGMYGNRDTPALWIVGTQLLFDVRIDALDRELEARGNPVSGDFTVCAERMDDLKALTARDRIEVIGYANLSYRTSYRRHGDDPGRNP